MMGLLSRFAKSVFLGMLPDRFAIPVRYYYRRHYGYLEREFLILDRLVGRCSVAIDIGGNDGFYSYALSKLCGRVEYFEPNPECAGWIRAYSASNININIAALSSSPGELKLHIPVTKGKPNTGMASLGKTFEDEKVIEIRTSTLDDYGFRDVSFIKIDVEGHELHVIDGARNTIIGNRPVMLVEIEQTHLDFPAGQVFDRITGLGYNAYYFLDGKINAVRNNSARGWELPPTHVNNFIFLPVGNDPDGILQKGLP